MRYDPTVYPSPSQRMVTFACNGMVATSHPLAVQGGLDIMKKGGNAVDAAVAVAACLTVVEPTSNGLGGDGFAMVWSGGKLYGLNSSGPSPKCITLEDVPGKSMPKYGWPTVTVPGVTAGWVELWERFGELSFEEVMAPSIKYAEEGFPISPVVGKNWRAACKIYEKLTGDEFKYWFDTFAPDGTAPRIGTVWRPKDHADTLRKIAETKAETFYRGKLAMRIEEFSEEYGGFIRRSDLASFSPEWVDPLRVNYRGYDVWELPPNGQGLVALLALNMMKEFEFEKKDTADTFHKQIEAIKIAFKDGKKHITDPAYMQIPPEELLSKNYKDQIAENASDPDICKSRDSGTVYLATGDDQGNMVSYIQSNYNGFGSGLVVPGTGIALQNRGSSFSLDPGHPNSLEPGKRPYHTIIPGFLSKDGGPVGPFGVMGGFMQPQGHLQVIMNSLDFEHNPQAALDAPRWRWIRGRKVIVERGFPTNLVKELTKKEHEIEYSDKSGRFGRGQIIWKNGNVLAGGSDPRADGTAQGY